MTRLATLKSFQFIKSLYASIAVWFSRISFLKVAARTSSFFAELCTRLAKCAIDPKFVPNPVVALFSSNHSKVASMPKPVRGEFGETENFVYAGHIVLVSKKCVVSINKLLRTTSVLFLRRMGHAAHSILLFQAVVYQSTAAVSNNRCMLRTFGS